MDYIKNKKDNNLLINIANSLEQHSMQCRQCGDLAPPLQQKGHLYKCLSCEKTYKGIGYNFDRLKLTLLNQNDPLHTMITHNIQLQAEYFSDAINLLREKTHQHKATNPLYSKLIKRIFTKKRH